MSIFHKRKKRFCEVSTLVMPFLCAVPGFTETCLKGGWFPACIKMGLIAKAADAKAGFAFPPFLAVNGGDRAWSSA